VQGRGGWEEDGERRWFNIVAMETHMVITRDNHPMRQPTTRIFWRGWREEAVKELNKEMRVEGMSPHRRPRRTRKRRPRWTRSARRSRPGLRHPCRPRRRRRPADAETRARRQKRKVEKKVVEDDGEILVGDVGVGVDGVEKVGVEKVGVEKVGVEKKGFKDKIELKRSK